jgi:hypothetical protein
MDKKTRQEWQFLDKSMDSVLINVLLLLALFSIMIEGHHNWTSSWTMSNKRGASYAYMGR